MKRMLAVCTTALLAGALAVGGVTAASAEGESVDPATITTTAVEEAPATEAPVEAAVVEAPPAPAEEPAVETVVETPAVEAVTSTAPMTVKANSPPKNEAHPNQCLPLDSGKHDTTGEPMTVDVTAPDGQLISGYCVKAGSVNADNGPVYIELDEPVKSLSIAYPADKAVSHYSLSYVDAPVVELPKCTENLFAGFEDRGGLWEVTYGTQHTNTNGVAEFTNDSFGGLVAFNEGPIPAYMTGTEYRWLYVYGDEPNRTWTWDFADGTRVTAVASYTESGCPLIEWTYGLTPTFEPTCVAVTGYDTIIGDGVLTVEGNWATDTINVPFTGTLADIGTVLNIDADPLPFVGLHIDTAEGTIVFEEETSYNGKLWSEDSWDGVSAGLGYDAMGTIGEYIHLNGDVVVEGIRLLYTHPSASSTTVTSFTIGCTVYTFEPPVIVPDQPEPESDTKFESITDCEARMVSTQEFEQHTLEPTYDQETNTWTQGEWSDWTAVGEPVVREATEEECPLPPVEELPNCEDLTQEEARALLDEDAEKYGYLDGDNDGVACESSPSVPPVTPEKPVTPTSVDKLPFTGFDDTLLLVAAWLLGLGALGLVGAKLIRGRN